MKKIYVIILGIVITICIVIILIISPNKQTNTKITNKTTSTEIIYEEKKH